MRLRLRDCSNEEVAVLAAIISLAKTLPYDLISYTPVIGEMTQKYWRGKGARKHQEHNPMPGSVAQTKSVRVTKRWM